MVGWGWGVKKKAEMGVTEQFIGAIRTQGAGIPPEPAPRRVPQRIRAGQKRVTPGLLRDPGVGGWGGEGVSGGGGCFPAL